MPLNGLTYDEFSKGYTLFVFDLQQYKNDVLCERKTGHTRLEITFSEALASNVSLIAYGKFDQELRIDESRTVTVK